MHGDSTFDVDRQDAGSGSIINVGGDHTVYGDSQAAAMAMLRDAGAATKLLFVLGFACALSGLGVFGFTMFTHNPELGSEDFGKMPAGIPLAFGIFFVGVLLTAVAMMAAWFGRRR